MEQTDQSNVTFGVSGHFGTSDDLIETIPIPNNNLPTSMKDSLKRQGLMPGDLPTSAEIGSDSHPAGASRKISPRLSQHFVKARARNSNTDSFYSGMSHSSKDATSRSASRSCTSTPRHTARRPSTFAAKVDINQEGDAFGVN